MIMFNNFPSPAIIARADFLQALGAALCNAFFWLKLNFNVYDATLSTNTNAFSYSIGLLFMIIFHCQQWFQLFSLNFAFLIATFNLFSHAFAENRSKNLFTCGKGHAVRKVVSRITKCNEKSIFSLFQTTLIVQIFLNESY